MSIGLSFVPNWRMANSLTHTGTWSITHSPTETTGEVVPRTRPATSWATPRATAADRKPASAPCQRGVVASPRAGSSSAGSIEMAGDSHAVTPRPSAAPDDRVAVPDTRSVLRCSRCRTTEAVGEVPRKRHTLAGRRVEGRPGEELMGQEGFAAGVRPALPPALAQRRERHRAVEWSERSGPIAPDRPLTPATFAPAGSRQAATWCSAGSLCSANDDVRCRSGRGHRGQPTSTATPSATSWSTSMMARPRWRPASAR